MNVFSTKKIIPKLLLLFLLLFPISLSAEYGDIIMNGKQEQMRKAEVLDVLFPHWFHRIRFRCKTCHDDIFKMKSGGNDIDMQQIIDGNACGKCHNGEIAWTTESCTRCHAQEPGWSKGPVQWSEKIE